jgi:hypothetical protein
MARASILAQAERRDCIAKMQKDVFHSGPEGVVRAEARFDAKASMVRVRVTPPSGKTVEAVVRPEVSTEAETVRAKGQLEISLAAIGSDVVKGPMNAFRVKDKVAITFDVVFVRA